MLNFELIFRGHQLESTIFACSFNKLADKYSINDNYFPHFRSFFNRHYLCESLVWTCELSGQSNLNYSQALKSEKEAQKNLDSLSICYQKAALSLIHHTRRTNLKTLCEEIVSFYKRRFIVGEVVDQSQTNAHGIK